MWSPILNQCLSPAITIAPGAAHTDSLVLWGAPPGGNIGPEFTDTSFDGSYRLVWVNIVTHYNTSTPGFGDSIPAVHRTSNEFTLRARGAQ